MWPLSVGQEHALSWCRQSFSVSCSSPGLVVHSDLDERALEALKEFNEDGALQVLLEFKDSDLSHVQVSVYRWTVAGVKSFRGQESKFPSKAVVDKSSRPSLQNKSAFLCGVMKTYRQREKQGTKVLESNKGPDEAKIKVCLSFLLDVYVLKSTLIMLVVGEGLMCWSVTLSLSTWRCHFCSTIK